MDGGIFVAGEADVADLAGLAGGDGGVDGAAVGEDAVGVFHADDFVELDEVDVVGVEAGEGLLELLVVFGGGAAVHFGHEEDLVAVAVLEGLAHAEFGGAVVVVPAVVEEGDAVVDGGVDDLEAVFGVRLMADVEAAEADGGDGLAGGAELAVDHVGGLGAGGGGRGGRGRLGDRVGGGGGYAGRGCGLEEVSAFHDASPKRVPCMRGLEAAYAGLRCGIGL